jgi:hypothetical protein
MEGTTGRRQIGRRALAVLVILVAAPLAAGAGTPPADAAAADAWRALTTNDVEAARALLTDNDPAAVPGVDPTFVRTLDAAYAHALAQAKKVTSYPGYVATLGELANSMNDGHLWSHRRYERAGFEWGGIVFRPPSLEWAGLIAAKRGRDWVISQEDPSIVGEDLVGSRLTDCGGDPIDEFARDKLGRYRVVWSVEAMRVTAAPWLLVDDENPFVKRPDSCVFRTASGTRKVSLNWKRVSRATFVAMIGDVHGRAGFGLRQVGSGYWIGIESLSAPAQAVIDAAKAQQAKLQAAPFVVVDLRGNSGGSDSYGRALADVLYGEAHTEAVLGPHAEQTPCPEAWRASPENLAAMEEMAKKFAAVSGAEASTDYQLTATQAAVTAMRTALAEHKMLTAPSVCPAAKGAAGPKAASAGGARSRLREHVIVLTDSVCFSSCINTVGFFEELGATLAGQTTGADTHYGEVREIVLPSGLSTFSVLQAIDPTQPPHIGPYAPVYPYGGDISDTAALEKWVSQAVVPELR